MKDWRETTLKKPARIELTRPIKLLANEYRAMAASWGAIVWSNTGVRKMTDTVRLDELTVFIDEPDQQPMHIFLSCILSIVATRTRDQASLAVRETRSQSRCHEGRVHRPEIGARHRDSQ